MKLARDVPVSVPPVNVESVIVLVVILESLMLDIVTLVLITFEPDIFPPVIIILSNGSNCIALTISPREIFFVPSSPCARLTMTNKSLVEVSSAKIDPSCDIFDI